MDNPAHYTSPARTRAQPRTLVRCLFDSVDRHELIEAFAAIAVEKWGRATAHGIAQAIERRIDRA